jgi:hypothetical protein
MPDEWKDARVEIVLKLLGLWRTPLCDLPAE